jgi:hypothetical protein
MPKLHEITLRGYHRRMIPHAAEIIDFDRANEYVKDFFQLEPLDELDYIQYPIGKLREYRAVLELEVDALYEIKTLVDKIHHKQSIVDNQEIRPLINHYFIFVQKGFRLITLDKRAANQIVSAFAGVKSEKD